MPTIAVCIPIAEKIHPSMWRSLVNLDLPRPYHLFDIVRHPVADARNMITADALKVPEVTHLLWIDDDMTFAPDAARRLLDLDLPIVSGLCFGRRHPYPPILMHKPTDRDLVGGYAYRYDYPEEVVEVDATGAAFLLVKREVFERIREKFPAADPWDQISSGEDVAFCARAKECGYSIKVDCRIKIGHIGEVVVEEAFARRNRTLELNPWIPKSKVATGAPVATIVIPTFNQKPTWLRQAIESAIAQTVPVEIIVIDNGSAACLWCGAPLLQLTTLHRAHDNPSFDCPGPPAYPHLRQIRIEKNSGGPWPALNLGIREMRTDWFTWLSSDDVFGPRKIERQLRSTRARNGLASFHGYTVIAGEGEPAAVVAPPMWRSIDEQRQALASGCSINGLSVMIHRHVFDRAGKFNEDLQIVADWDLWNRIARDFFWHPIPELLATRREWDNATTRYAKDPVMRERWQREDGEVRRRYRRPWICAACKKVEDAELYAHAETGEEDAGEGR